MAVTASDVKTLGGSAFSGASDSTVTTWLAVGARQISESALGDLYDDALKFWTLHNLAVNVLSGAGAAGAAGAVSSVKVGSVSVGYATPSQDASSYESTSWGRMFLDLMRMRVSGFAVADTVRDVT